MVGGECVKQQFGMKCMYATKHRNVDKSHASSSIFKNNLKSMIFDDVIIDDVIFDNDDFG